MWPIGRASLTTLAPSWHPIRSSSAGAARHGSMAVLQRRRRRVVAIAGDAPCPASRLRAGRGGLATIRTNLDEPGPDR